MTRIMKSAGALVLAGVLLAGCGTGPAEVDSAAIIGKDSVPLAGFQHEITRLIDTKQAAKQVQRQRTMDQAARNLLTIRVQHRIVRDVAAREHLSVDQGFVNRQMSVPGLDKFLETQVLDRAGFAGYQADLSLMMDLARKQADRLTVRADIVGGLDPAQARELAANIARQPAKGGDLMRTASPDAELNQTLRPAEGVPTTVFSGTPGSVLAFPAGGQDARWYVVRVLSRDQGQPSQGQDRLSLDALAGVGRALLVPDAQRIGVRINPRFGAWDDYTLSVVPSGAEKRVLAFPSSAGPGA
ncbi:hypothetical protein [Sciscionella marina]|uniref:hypothetical protein n=1 Tax=Sciscionella marina TaxID=508770 RepID=UPI0003799059|nr:hypothetical protein [Sciscionella marina]